MTLLTLDLGNTTLSGCLFSSTGPDELGRLRSDKLPTINQQELLNQLKLNKECWQSIHGVTIASVVPHYNKKLTKLLSEVIAEKNISFLSARNSPLPLRVKQSRQVGSDIIANALGAWGEYESSTLIIDFGTATTFDLVADGAYRGSAIAPNLSSSLQQLTESTALLEGRDLQPVKSVLGKTTEAALDAGFFRGFRRMVEGLIADFKRERDIEQVIATGKAANTLQREINAIDDYEPLLTHKGLKLAWNKGLNRQ